jgi:hypothetical protein
MNLSPHFTLEEAILSQTAARCDIGNYPTSDIVQNMKHAAEGMELVRKELNSNAILVSSWFRSLELNRAVGSKDTSAHITGFAVDFTCPTYGTPDTIVRKLISSKIPFQQVIREYDNWVHIAFNGLKREALIIDKTGTRAFV